MRKVARGPSPPHATLGLWVGWQVNGIVLGGSAFNQLSLKDEDEGEGYSGERLDWVGGPLITPQPTSLLCQAAGMAEVQKKQLQRVA